MSVIRLMMEDDDGLPKVGSGFGKLGVRLRNPAKPQNHSDVMATVLEDLVQPFEGMSCSTLAPADYLRWRKRPLEKKQFIWEISGSDLPPELQVLPAFEEDHPEHVLIAPRIAMECGMFVKLLVATRNHWRKV